jgi:hypothetical protein
MMKPTTTLFALILTGGLLSACGPDDRTAREELAVTASEDPGYATDQPAAVTPVPGTEDAQTLTGNLAEMGNSGASGVVTLTSRDGGTLIQLSVTGAQPGTELRPTIHRGRCGMDGEMARELERMRVEDVGLASANLTVPMPVNAIADGAHSVRIYPEAGFASPPLACADIPPAAPAESPL